MSLPAEKLSVLKARLNEMQTSLSASLKRVSRDLDFGDDTDSLEEESDEAEEVSNQAGITYALKLQLDRVKKALSRISSETYGTCLKCEGKIEPEVLDAAPESELCRACKLKL